MEEQDLFYKKSKDGLFAYLLRMTGDYHLANDLVQESFFRYLHHYRKNGKPNRSLLFTIARNAAMDAFRMPKFLRLNQKVHVDQRSDPEQQLHEQQSCNRIFLAIKQLTQDDRQLIALISGTDLSYDEVGKILNITEANVKVRVHRARLRLKAILAKGGD